MSAQHTPGPWRAGPVDDTLVTADGREIATIEGNYDDDWAAMEANARLIAAAPDMLNELLSAAEVYAEWHGKDSEEFRRINAVIAKARGA